MHDTQPVFLGVEMLEDQLLIRECTAVSQCRPPEAIGMDLVHDDRGPFLERRHHVVAPAHDGCDLINCGGEVPQDVALFPTVIVVGDTSGNPHEVAVLGDLVWDVPRLISYASSVMTLQPGDIITTGTPAGIGQIVDGDQITVEISNVGRLEVAVSSEEGELSDQGANRGPKPPEAVTPVRART